jgi:2-amino-4-hydroxy-6-hydroxymethyldihydropteridine diphosphokinase
LNTVTAYVAFGANLGDPRHSFAEACARLAALPGTRLAARSSLYRSAPVGVSGEQPDYVNAVVSLDTRLPALTLLDALQDIETAGGRQRDAFRAPRTLDLDLLLYADQCIEHPRLSVPHPRMHERAFVLLPLAEIAPQVSIPGQPAMDTLLLQVASQRVERLEG